MYLVPSRVSVEVVGTGADQPRRAIVAVLVERDESVASKARLITDGLYAGAGLRIPDRDRLVGRPGDAAAVVGERH